MTESRGWAVFRPDGELVLGSIAETMGEAVRAAVWQDQTDMLPSSLGASCPRQAWEMMQRAGFEVREVMVSVRDPRGLEGLRRPRHAKKWEPALS